MKRPTVIKRQLGVKLSTIDMVAAQVAAASSAETAEHEVRRVPLTNINIWDDQPRKILITMDDIYKGIVDFDDSQYDEKMVELESIIGLALSLKEFGMLNPPLAHAMPGRNVQLIGGQRRVMAAIYSVLHIESTIKSGRAQHDVKVTTPPNLELLENEKIEVKVYKKKPTEDDVERIGIADNAQRNDLPQSDVLRWLITYAKRKELAEEKFRHQDIISILGVNRSRAFELLKLIKHRHLPWVKEGCDKVCSGIGFTVHIDRIIDAPESERKNVYNHYFGSKPREKKRSKVSLGSTDNLPAIRNLIMANASLELKQQLDKVDWLNPKEVKKAFNDFFESWELTNG
tara:strand:+ start:4204 stop:5235 length:1032 start_codon:yes stop_codon:yes gene_type:complete